MVRRRFGLCLVFWVLALVRPASSRELSDFEREVRAIALRERGLTLEEAPAGKIIESIEVHVVEPFDGRDPVPDWVNVLHVNSRDYVVKQELALETGQVFERGRADDSIRNLKETYKFSLILVTTARGSAPDRVKVVVIVKDVWSLRLQWNASVVKDRLVLYLNPSETNLFGTHTTLGALYLLEPDRQTFGVNLYVPQVGGSNIKLLALGGPIFSRDLSETEGSFGYFQYYEPLKSRFDEWAWSTGVGWRKELTRRYEGADIREVEITVPDGSTLHIPETFETERMAGEYQLVRSFGSSNKTDLSFGMEADLRRYRTEDLSAYGPRAREEFERVVLPTTDTRISPFVQVTSYSTRTHHAMNVETLALQEDLALGHHTLLRVYPASTELGSSRSLFGLAWGVGYAVPLGSGIAVATAGASIELARHNQNNVLFDAGLRIVSPSLGPGRVHFDVVGYDRYRNYLNLAPFALGGDNRLRGYPYGFFQGDKLLALNTEFRSVPIELFGVHVAGVAFYDTGHAADTVQELSLKHSIGAGVRFLAPQFDRTVLRVDYGLALSEGYRGFGLVFEFGQALALPALLEPSVLSGVVPTVE
ncbi:MAG TPA: hypothetical protein VFU02_08355 [Polyangiaceae bacterium]|nr:hypothetical protein [Polyangiaceae bacterium]